MVPGLAFYPRRKMGSSQRSFLMGTVCPQMLLIIKTVSGARICPLSQVPGGTELLTKHIPQVRGLLRPRGSVLRYLTSPPSPGSESETSCMIQTRRWGWGWGRGEEERRKEVAGQAPIRMGILLIPLLGPCHNCAVSGLSPFWCQCCSVIWSCFLTAGIAVST